MRYILYYYNFSKYFTLKKNVKINAKITIYDKNDRDTIYKFIILYIYIIINILYYN